MRLASLSLILLLLACYYVSGCAKREQERNMQENTEGEIELQTWAGDVKGKFRIKRTQHETTVTEYSFKPPQWVQWATSASTWGLGGTGIGAGLLGLYAAWSQRRKRETHAQGTEASKAEQLENSRRQAGEIIAAISQFMKDSDAPTIERLKIALKAETSKDTRMLIAELK